MPMYEHKELQMNLGTGYTQVMVAFNLGFQYNKTIYKIKIIQTY